jgi:uncharacterized protein (TIGR00255 family)
MMRSMTGFGRAILELPGKKVTIEIKSLNSKQFDLTIKLPSIYREKEFEMRNLLAQKLERGKIDLFITVEETQSSNVVFNKDLAVNYYHKLAGLSAELGLKQEPDYLGLIIKMPEVLRTDYSALDKEEWEQLQQSLLSAIEQLNHFRKEEGEILHKDFGERTILITSYLDTISALETQRWGQRRDKLLKALTDLDIDMKIDHNRLEQELIYYLEKMDFTEEKVRLKKHCEFFIQTMEEETSQGRKLAFISQEIGREINTLGAKAYDAEIQKLVVNMKDELEKMKEQLLNIL